ncbi:hypothetical protein MBLNU13_g10823t1 [Cladosporium sp. NU13]
MKASGHIESIVDFAVPDDRFMMAASPEGISLLTAILSSPGALVARVSKETTSDILQELEIHLQRRFNFDWVLTNQSASRHVALIGSVPMFGAEKGSFGSRGPLEAAEVLGENGEPYGIPVEKEYGSDSQPSTMILVNRSLKELALSNKYRTVARQVVQHWRKLSKNTQQAFSAVIQPRIESTSTVKPLPDQSRRTKHSNGDADDKLGG